MFENIFINYFFLLKLSLLAASLCFSALLFFQLVSGDFFFKAQKIIFFTALGFVCARVVFLFWAQYLIWQGSYFLPPYQPLSYFLSYAWMHFAKPLAFDLGVGIFFFLFLSLGIKISRGRFFYDEEKYTGGTAILLNIWPVNILVVFLTLFFGLVFSSFRLFLKRDSQFLLSLRFFWLPVGLILLLFGDLLVNFLGLNVISI